MPGRGDDVCRRSSHPAGGSVGTDARRELKCIGKEDRAAVFCLRAYFKKPPAVCFLDLAKPEPIARAKGPKLGTSGIAKVSFVQVVGRACADARYMRGMVVSG